jgi:hypothetical protein
MNHLQRVSEKMTTNLLGQFEPGDLLINPEVTTIPNGVQITAWVGDDGAAVFEIATTPNVPQRVRVFVNEGMVYDDTPSDDEGVAIA